MLSFATGWKTARPEYTQKYGHYQAFLDSFTEQSIRDAFKAASGKFADEWVKKFIDDANGSTVTLPILQGSHQPEDLEGGGFCLHFTGKDADKYSFHFYIVQDKESGKPIIFAASYYDSKLYTETLAGFQKVSKN